MEETGYIHVLIGIFTAIGSLFTGGRGAPQEVATPTAQVAVLTLDLHSNEATDEELGAAIEVLENRFPGAKASVQSATPQGKRCIVIDGALDTGDESLAQLATQAGGFRMLMMASAEDMKELSVDLAAETSRVHAFLAANGARTLAEYNALSVQNGGSPDRLVFAMDSDHVPSPLCVETDERWRFDQSAIARTFVSYDHNGRPAVGFDIEPSRQADFEAFTAHHEGERLALVVGTKIVTSPNLNSPLRSGGIITGGAGGFSLEETTSLCTLISTQKLETRLELRSIVRRDP